MEKLIACCGLNCSTCEARIATIKNDDELRKATADKLHWMQRGRCEVRALEHVPDQKLCKRKRL
jgi:hypothetical protein